MSKHADYLQAAFDQDTLIEHALDELEGHEFDAIIGIGMSGALAVPLLAHALGKRFGLVRKKKAPTHSSYDVESNLHPCDKWIFVDDFVSSGFTRRAVLDAMGGSPHSRSNTPADYKFVGQYMYHHWQIPRFKGVKEIENICPFIKTEGA